MGMAKELCSSGITKERCFSGITKERRFSDMTKEMCSSDMAEGRCSSGMRLCRNVILSRQAKNLVFLHPVVIRFFTEFTLKNVNRVLRHSLHAPIPA